MKRLKHHFNLVFVVLAHFCLCACTLQAAEQGQIYGWGESKLPNEPLTNITQISAGAYHSLALKSDGSIVGWGRDNYGQATPPDGNDFVAIDAGVEHSLALKSDGSIVGWGYDSYGQIIPPEGNAFIAIAAGGEHSLALKSNGSIVGRGADEYGEATPPEGKNFIAIDAGYYHQSLAIRKVCRYLLVGDVNDDCKFDINDFVIMAANWLIDCDLEPSNPACTPK